MVRRVARVRLLGLAALLAVSLSPVAKGAWAAEHEDLQVPNLVPLVPTDIGVDYADGSDVLLPTFAIRFTTSIANRGEYALDLLGRPDPTRGMQAAAAEQCVRWAATVCLERRSAGDFVWHSGTGHNHYHLEGFAKYELRRLLEDGSPDLTDEGLAAGGEKVSFCIVDFERDPESSSRPPNPLYSTSTCNILFQGISPSWMDTYGRGLGGQQILIHPDLVDGKYALMITVDPDGKLYESEDGDNASFRRVELYNDRRRVRLLP